MAGQNIGKSTNDQSRHRGKVYEKIGFQKEASDLVEMVLSPLKIN